MSLSEQELRALQEIEQSLLADDPKFGSTVSNVGLQETGFGFSLRGVAIFVLGLVALIGGIALSQVSLWFIALSVVGFLLMFGAGLWMLRGGGASRMKISGAVPLRDSASSQRTPHASGFTDRMDERFRSRFDDGQQGNF